MFFVFIHSFLFRFFCPLFAQFFSLLALFEVIYAMYLSLCWMIAFVDVVLAFRSMRFVSFRLFFVVPKQTPTEKKWMKFGMIFCDCICFIYSDAPLCNKNKTICLIWFSNAHISSYKLASIFGKQNITNTRKIEIIFLAIFTYFSSIEFIQCTAHKCLTKKSERKEYDGNRQFGSIMPSLISLLYRRKKLRIDGESEEKNWRNPVI